MVDIGPGEPVKLLGRGRLNQRSNRLLNVCEPGVWLA